MKKRTNQYWTERDEALVIDYINSIDQHERSKIYNQLRPAILKLIQGVYRKYVVIDDRTIENEAKVDVEVHLVEKVIPNFKPAKGTKAYSYLSNSVKNFFWDVRKIKKKESVLESLYQYWDNDNEGGELKLTVDKPDESTTLIEQNEEYEYLLDKAKNTINHHLQDCTWNQRLVLNALMELVDQKYYEKHYCTYFLMAKTKLIYPQIFSALKRFDMDNLIARQELSFYKNLIEENKKKNVFNVRTILASITHKGRTRTDEERYKITDRKGNYAKAKAKRLKLKNEKIYETAG